MKKQQQEMEITSLKSFFKVWWRCIRLKDELFWNAMAWVMVGDVMVIVYSMAKIVGRVFEI